MPAEAGDGLGVEGTVTAREVSRELWSLGGVHENLERRRSGVLVMRSHVRDRGRSRRKSQVAFGAADRVGGSAAFPAFLVGNSRECFHLGGAL